MSVFDRNPLPRQFELNYLLLRWVLAELTRSVVTRIVVLIGALLVSGCGSGSNIFMLLEKQYWRPEDQVCPAADQSCSEGKWETNWQVWYETEQECLEAIDETQRCRNTRL